MLRLARVVRDRLIPSCTLREVHTACVATHTPRRGSWLWFDAPTVWHPTRCSAVVTVRTSTPIPHTCTSRLTYPDRYTPSLPHGGALSAPCGNKGCTLGPHGTPGRRLVPARPSDSVASFRYCRRLVPEGTHHEWSLGEGLPGKTPSGTAKALHTLCQVVPQAEQCSE